MIEVVLICAGEFNEPIYLDLAFGDGETPHKIWNFRHFFDHQKNGARFPCKSNANQIKTHGAFTVGTARPTS
jgi:hypothetical protein